MQDLLKRMSGLETLRHSVVVTDAAGTVTYWNAAAERLLGWASDEVLGRRLTDVVALETTPDELVQRLLADPDWTGEMALRRRAGTAFLARLHQQGLVDELGHLTGTLRIIADITDSTWATRARQERGERAVRALEAAGVGAWQLDAVTGLATWDERMEALFGLEPGSFPGSQDSWLALIHPDDAQWVQQEIAKISAQGGSSIDVEYRVGPADGPVRWVKVVGRTFAGASRAVTAMAGVAYDITERRRAEEERTAFLASERARRDRFTLLAEASAAFAASLDDADVMAAVGKLVVPRLADWFAIDLVQAGGDVRTVAAVHSDPSRRELVAYLGRRFGGAGGILPDVRAVLDDGTARLHERIDLADWSEVAADPEHRAVLGSVGVHSAMVVPLTARGRTFGAMTFVIGESRLSYSNEDLDLAEDLARRAALSIDNALLFADRTHVARVLQRSLLPPALPEVPGAEVAARDRASQANIEIGGDFYDVFQTGGDRWSLVLGDVSGKGTDAAVLTGLARHTVRAAAMRAPGPVEVLSSLNQAILGQDYGERFVTLAYVQMAVAASRAHLVVSSAGHPSPLVVRSDGTVEGVTACGGIIGLFDDVPIEHEVLALLGGDALVLYTDGVLEARDARGAFFGEQRLSDLLATCGGRPAAEIAERVEAAAIAFSDGAPRDDIAILVVRIDETAASSTQESNL